MGSKSINRGNSIWVQTSEYMAKAENPPVVPDTSLSVDEPEELVIEEIEEDLELEELPEEEEQEDDEDLQESLIFLDPEDDEDTEDFVEEN